MEISLENLFFDIGALWVLIGHSPKKKKDLTVVRAVNKISSFRVITTSSWGIKQLRNSFASIFLLFFYRSSQGQCS